MKNYYLKLFAVLLLIFITSLYYTLNAQQSIFDRKGIIENLSITYLPIDISDFSETGNINFQSGNIVGMSANAYLISNPQKISFELTKPFIAFSYVLYANRTDLANISFYYSYSADSVSYTAWKYLDIEAENDTALISKLAFLDNNAVFFKYKILFNSYNPGFNLNGFKLSFTNPGITPTEMHYNLDNSAKELKSTKPGIISRTQWACNDGQNAPLWSPQYTTVTHQVIHHTDGSNNISQDYAATVRSIWYQHTYTNGWGDIGYNYLIDGYGRTYEGRAGGNNVIGAHCGKNTGTMGVSIMGTYTSMLPTDTSIGTLVSLLSWKCSDSKINPIGNSFHASSGLNLNNLCGHKDIKATECPGITFYAELTNIRNDVNKLLLTNPSQSQNEIFCYPNPFRETALLDIKHINWSVFTIEINDIYGRLIYKREIKNFTSGIIPLNLHFIDKGIYMLRIITPTDVLFYEKILKIK